MSNTLVSRAITALGGAFLVTQHIVDRACSGLAVTCSTGRGCGWQACGSWEGATGTLSSTFMLATDYTVLFEISPQFILAPKKLWVDLIPFMAGEVDMQEKSAKLHFFSVFIP